MKRMMILASMLMAHQAMAEGWDAHNNPAQFNVITGSNMIATFRDLPLKAKLIDDRLGWSETYWPSNRGGIAYRWNSPHPENFHYKLKTQEELAKMSLTELSELSPAELYDIAEGDYSYTLTKLALSRVTPHDLWWEGICHGWSLAAANYPEPAKVVITNKDGIKVPFGSSDVKGLLAMHDAYNSSGIYARVGERCSAHGKVPGEGDARDSNTAPPPVEEAEADNCRDTNAGAFHIVLTNMIAIHSKGFVADVDRYNDIWNQPVTGYESSIVEITPASADEMSSGIEKHVHMKTKMTYGEELQFFTHELEAQGRKNFVSKDPVTGTEHQEFRSKDYEYILELDEAGRIVGGVWISATRPDFIWVKKRDTKFLDTVVPMTGLSRIYHPVRR
jgi:hypothetical protein